jgi:hypothetical protein
MNARHCLQSIAALAAGLCAFTAVHAAEVVGRVLLAGGDAFAVRDGKDVRLAFNSPIEFKDVLRTGPASSLQVRFVDDSLISVRENTEFAIEEYQFGGKPEEQRSFFRLVKGGFRAVTGLIGRTNHANYRVRAENATIGIRGTDYAVRECRGDCGAGIKDGLYGTVHGISNGTNQVALTNNSGETVFGINQHFYVPDANTRPQPLLAPPSFVSIKPQGKAQTSQQGSGGSGGEQATSSSGASGDSRPSTVVDATTPTTVAPVTTTYTVTNTLTSSGTTALVPGFTLGGVAIVPGSLHNDEGGGAFLTSSMLTLNASGIPTAINIPTGCTGPNSDCKGGFTASLGTPLQTGSAFPNGSTQAIFWGRWASGTVDDGNGATTLSSTTQAHFMYGTLTPADVLSAKTGTLTLSSTFPGLGTTATNNFGATPSAATLPVISVNFDARTASVSASSIQFGGGSPQLWTIPTGSGPLTIVAGAGGFFRIEGSGNQGTGGWSCTGTGCSGAAFLRANASGIFFGPVGDHAGVSLGANAFNSSGTLVGNFGTVRVYCVSGC